MEDGAQNQARDRGGLHGRASLGEEIYEVMLTQLITLKIPPGERLSIDALVREFGVSQTPIRAALIRLEAEGLVVRKHNSGYSAASIPNGHRFGEIYDFRLILEPAAAAKATGRLTPAQQAELIDTSAEMNRLVGDGSEVTYGRFAVLDARFHQLIAQACGNQLVIEALDRLYAHMHLFRLRFHSTVTEEAVVEHKLVVDAMLAGHEAAAAAAMRRHIESSRQRMEPFYRTLA
ncbi:GntR family transcriptional regulator [Aureimonas flava]|nr:GntR family transcriptional regulator [Aureimonas flava]